MENFELIADNTLQELIDYFEEIDSLGLLECDLIDGVLTIDIDDEKKQFVINKHNESNQIWYSSPVSGGSHFTYDADSESWLDSEGNELEETLKSEVENLSDI